MADQPAPKPHMAMHGPCTVRDLKPGEVKYWCTCGLSKNQPWCDGSHKTTSFRPLKWTVPENPQTLYSICACKYTQSPPLCDGSHSCISWNVQQQIENCASKGEHENLGDRKLCEKCGFVPDW